MKDKAKKPPRRDGCISDADVYVLDRYGDGFELLKSNSLKNFEYVEQADFSALKRRLDDGRVAGEGNCSLSSAYALLNYFSKSGTCPSFPSGSNDTEYDISAEKKFARLKDKKQLEPHVRRMPRLYIDVRKTAVEKCGYGVRGTNPFFLPRILRLTAKKYGVRLKIRHRIFWSFGAAQREIDENRPLIWNMANSKTYHSHTTVVTGYRLYEKKCRFLCFDYTKSVRLLQLNDNWTKAPRFFDLTNYRFFGSMITAKIK